jgi:hypothetical protein
MNTVTRMLYGRCRFGLALVGLVCLGADLACSEAESAPLPPAPAPPVVDAPDAGLADGVAPAGFVSAPHAAQPQIPNQGGATLSSVEIATVTFAGNTDRVALEAFGDFIVQSSWLAAVGSDYGVGNAAHVGKVSLPALGATSKLTDTDVQGLIDEAISSGSLPVESGPGKQMLYVLYVPRTTTIDVGGGFTIACGALGDSYHNGVAHGTARYAYAVVLGCPFGGFTPVEAAENVASHEIIEAMTDPYPTFDRGFAMTDPNEPWAALGGEVADLCPGLSVREAGHVLQRVWSNSAATERASAPCIPAPPDDPYFAVSTDPVLWSVSPGQSLTIPVSAWSTGPVDAWTLTAARATGDLAVELAVDRPLVQNGDTATLTIGVPAGAKRQTYAVVELFSYRASHVLDGPFTPWPIGIYVP